MPTVAPIATPRAETVATPTAETGAASAAESAAASTTGPDEQATVEPEFQPERRDLDLPAVPVVGDALPRIRNTLGGIASTPRRRVTLMAIQGLAFIFAIGVFAHLILRRR